MAQAYLFRTATGKEFTTDNELVARVWARAGLELVPTEAVTWPELAELEAADTADTANKAAALPPPPAAPSGAWRPQLGWIVAALCAGWALAATYYLVWRKGR